jgi:DNA-binding MarR family transcriptional regulator
MASSTPVPGTVPAGTPAPAELARLEVALAAVTRWSESKHTRAEVARLSGCDIPPSALRLLEHFDVAGAMRVSDIAECLHIDISTVSLQLRHLKAGELVNRLKDPTDGRSGVIAISPRGREVLARVRAARCELLAEVFARTPSGELGRAADTLIRFQDHMLDGMSAAGYAEPLG